MMKMIKSKKALTLPEIIVSMVIIVLTAGVTFTAYSQAYRFSDRFKHKSLATNNAIGILDQLRARNAYDAAVLTVNDTNADGVVDIDRDGNGTIGNDGDYYAVAINGWTLNSEVTSLLAHYTVANVWFDNSGIETNAAGDANNPGNAAFNYNAKRAAGTISATRPAFKKIIMTVSWQEPHVS